MACAITKFKYRNFIISWSFLTITRGEVVSKRNINVGIISSLYRLLTLTCGGGVL